MEQCIKRLSITNWAGISSRVCQFVLSIGIFLSLIHLGLNILYRPCLTQPCGHLFCEPCLRRAKISEYSTWGPFIYYVITCRGEGGGVRKCHFLLILSTKNQTCWRRGEGGPKIPKMWWRNIWMVPCALRQDLDNSFNIQMT